MNMFEPVGKPYENEWIIQHCPQAKIVNSNSVRTVLVPYWVQQVLARNKMNYIDILDYEKVRKVMSADDVASMMALNNLNNNNMTKFSKHTLLNELFRDWSNGDLWWGSQKSDANQKEYNNVIQPLSTADITLNNVFERLCFDEGVTFDTNSYGDLYKLQVNNDGTIFVFLQKGLLNALEDRSFALKLTSEYLQTLYGLLSIPEVSTRSAFQLYYKLI